MTSRHDDGRPRVEGWELVEWLSVGPYGSPLKAFLALLGTWTVMVVGGAVRDFTWSGPAALVRDIDLMVDGDRSEVFAALDALAPHRPTWFGNRTYLLPDNRTIDVFPVADALGRRSTIEGAFISMDFSMNAVGVDLRTGVLHDIVGGIEDIGRRRLRPLVHGWALDDRIAAQRLLRACDFVDRLEFQSVEWGMLDAAAHDLASRSPGEHEVELSVYWERRTSAGCRAAGSGPQG
ncbi:MAG TPA: hypothetical protein VK507_07565 [Iamia sp.]|nr:hypothetical protein [Iamia sp.]